MNKKALITIVLCFTFILCTILLISDKYNLISKEATAKEQTNNIETVIINTDTYIQDTPIISYIETTDNIIFKEESKENGKTSIAEGYYYEYKKE